MMAAPARAPTRAAPTPITVPRATSIFEPELGVPEPEAADPLTLPEAPLAPEEMEEATELPADAADDSAEEAAEVTLSAAEERLEAMLEAGSVTLALDSIGQETVVR